LPKIAFPKWVTTRTWSILIILKSTSVEDVHAAEFTDMKELTALIENIPYQRASASGKAKNVKHRDLIHSCNP
jgi:hypothetical protein